MTGRRRSGTRRAGAEVLTLKGHTAVVISASFSPDGSRIVTASQDKTAKVWDARSGAEVLTLKGHTGSASIAFGVVQPGRVAGRHREWGPDGEGLGREEWCRGPHTQGAHRARLFGVVQPRRVADRDREFGLLVEGLGRAAVQAIVSAAGSRLAATNGKATRDLWARFRPTAKRTCRSQAGPVHNGRIHRRAQHPGTNRRRITTNVPCNDSEMMRAPGIHPGALTNEKSAKIQREFHASPIVCSTLLGKSRNQLNDVS